MTTPPTPAGWYPDPDGSGGQRYWDGSGWTEHRSPATHERAAASRADGPCRNPLAASSRPPSCRRGPPGSTSAHTGRPSREPEPEPTPEPTAAEPEPGPTAVIDLARPCPVRSRPRPSIPPPPPPFDAPWFAGAPFARPGRAATLGEPAERRTTRRQLMIWFGAACAALLAVLVLSSSTAYSSTRRTRSRLRRAPAHVEIRDPDNLGGHRLGQRHGDRKRITHDRFRFRPPATDGGLTFAVTGTKPRRRCSTRTHRWRRTRRANTSSCT